MRRTEAEERKVERARVVPGREGQEDVAEGARHALGHRGLKGRLPPRRVVLELRQVPRVQRRATHVTEGARPARRRVHIERPDAHLIGAQKLEALFTG